MKKLILIGFVVLSLTGCVVKSPSDNEIRRGMETHNFLVISEQNKVIIEQNKQILELFLDMLKLMLMNGEIQFIS